MSEENDKIFHLQVMSVNGTFYDDGALEIIVPCEDGLMAFLYGHEEMILALSDGIININRIVYTAYIHITSLGNLNTS